jgi:hypothetical protein
MWAMELGVGWLTTLGDVVVIGEVAVIPVVTGNPPF